MSEPPDWTPPVRTCALCRALTIADDLTLPCPADSPAFAPYEGAAMHGACLAAWPERDRALRSFFAGRRRSWRSQPRWVTVHEDHDLAALVGGDATPVEARVVLAGALHEWALPVREWRERVSSDEVPSWWLSFERDAWAAARPALAAAVPGLRALLDRSDWETHRRLHPRPPTLEQSARERAGRDAASQATLARRALALASTRERLAAGTLACPRCRAVAPHRLRAGYLVCAACHRSFEPS